MVVALQRRGQSLSEHLERLRERYGPLEYRTGYFLAPQPAASRAVFEHLRAGGGYVRVPALSRPSSRRFLCWWTAAFILWNTCELTSYCM